MRATRDRKFAFSVMLFKSIVMIEVVLAITANRVSYMPPQPQRSNVFFPTHPVQHSAKAPNIINNPTTPVLTHGSSSSNGFNSNTNQFGEAGQSEFEVGNTGIACNNPGSWAPAEDTCNRCFCASNGQLSAVCTRALCPPGFPSTVQQSQLKLQ